MQRFEAIDCPIIGLFTPRSGDEKADAEVIEQINIDVDP